VGPGEPWERIPADLGMDFYLKIPAGKDPGNLRVHPCPALPSSKIKPPTSLWKGEGLGLHPLLLREWKGAHIPQWRGGAHSWVDGQRWRN